MGPAWHFTTTSLTGRIYDKTKEIILVLRASISGKKLIPIMSARKVG